MRLFQRLALNKKQLNIKAENLTARSIHKKISSKIPFDTIKTSYFYGKK